MNVKKIQDKQVAIAVSEEEAGDILAGLIRHADDFGDKAAALRAQMEAAGVAAPPPPDHIRHEF